MESYQYGSRRGVLPDGVFDADQWQSSRDDAMQLVLKCKFAACEPLRSLLMSTHPHRLASVKSDAYWGIGTHGNGENKLALQLEELRAALCEDTRTGSQHENFDRLWPTDQLAINQLNSFTTYQWKE